MSTRLNYYRSELKSKNVAKYKLIGINSELILNTTIFPRNKDIVAFLKTIYNLTYRIYIIKSRTLILARTTRDIYEMDSKEYEISRKKLLDFVNGYLELSAKNKESITTNNDFSKWMDGIKDADS
ncbi:hypothetical protein [Virgibacillus dakarensis]|uniref:hypothetical protein n=1 Tax=Virgibacillus dakarensis TaxID=1917889 RepID=UPI000B4444BA|nr:hypothetical protein [Virgibacillus dakarensis]